MEVAVMASLFTKRDMNIDACHGSKGKRNYGFLKIYVNKDYSVPGTRITEPDKDNFTIINALRNKRERIEFFGSWL
jgi:hypothetical protein